jgi:hypothetical protein
MHFNVTFDASVSATAQTAINNVLGVFVNNFSDNVTVNIKFQFGTTGLGQSSSALFGTYTYAQIKSALQGDSKSSDDSSAVASLPASDPIGVTHSYYVTKAQGKALGLVGADSTLDGTVTISNAQPLDYDRTNGITAGSYDFQGVIAHEVSEVMGRGINAIGSNVQTGPANAYYPLDLFKFTGTGAHSFVGTTAGYFSVNNGATSLAAFNTNPNGDFGDWASSVPADAARAFSNSGVINDFSSTDVREMDTIGWDTLDPRFHGVRSWDFNWGLIASGHYNHDGTTDVIWQNPSGVLGGWLINNNQVSGTLQLPTFPGWNVVANGDFNHDGNTDIMWQNASGLVAEWFMGNGTRQGTATIQNMPGWHAIATGDYNHDGISDVIWDNGNGVEGGWLMNSNGQIGGTLQLPFFPGWTAIANIDINGDGNTDIIWQNASGLVAAWYMGNGTRQGTATFENKAGWSVLATGDFNHDGYGDILWRTSPGTTQTWLFSNGAHVSTIDMGSTAGWYARAQGDFNFDGFGDVMWQDAVSGQIATWLFGPSATLKDNGGLDPQQTPPDAVLMSDSLDDFNGPSLTTLFGPDTSTNGIDGIGGGDGGGGGGGVNTVSTEQPVPHSSARGQTPVPDASQWNPVDHHFLVS